MSVLASHNTAPHSRSSSNVGSAHAPSFHCPATPFNVSDGCAVSIGLCYGDARDVQAQWDGADNLTVATMIHTALFSKRFVWAESRD